MWTGAQQNTPNRYSLEQISQMLSCFSFQTVDGCSGETEEKINAALLGQYSVFRFFSSSFESSFSTICIFLYHVKFEKWCSFHLKKSYKSGTSFSVWVTENIWYTVCISNIDIDLPQLACWTELHSWRHEWWKCCRWLSCWVHQSRGRTCEHLLAHDQLQQSFWWWKRLSQKKRKRWASFALL